MEPKKKRFFIFIPLILAILFLLLLVTKSPGTSARNIIFILVDALRSDHLQCYGYDRGISPNIDNLAREGILFKNSVAQSSWTKPSFSALITANHPTSIGITNMNDGLINNITTVAELLKQNGFYTCAFISNPYLVPDQGFDQGFDEYHTLFPTNLSEYKIDADEVNRQVFRWLEKNKDRKFFLFIFYLDPHTPYNPKPPFDTLFSPVSHAAENLWKEKIANPPADYLKALIDLYDGEISFLDNQLGKLFDHLKKLNLWDKSLLVLNSDHGEEFYDHWWWQHNHTLYEELLRVPLIIRGPGLPKGIRVLSPVQHIEVFPTIFDLMGINQSRTFTGQSVSELISKPEKIINKATYHETYLKGKSFIALRGIKWKIIFNLEKNTYQFFDLEKDPKEKNDLLKSSGGFSVLGTSPEIKNSFISFRKSLHKMAEQAYKLRHLRRAFKTTQYDKDAMRILEGLGYILD